VYPLLQSIHGLDSLIPRGICMQSSLLWRNELWLSPVVYLFSPQLSLADAQSTVFRGISPPKEDVLVEYPGHFVC
jgi:hypothetical protein